MATSSSSSPAVSVIIPTRNRRALWESGPLLPSLLAQSDLDLELVIAVDHAEDDTLEYLTTRFTAFPPPFPVSVLDVLAPRPGPFPASGVPDNCAIHAARGARILHLDDDLDVHRELVAYAKTLPAAATVWGQLVFCGPDWLPLPGSDALDCRPALLARFQHSRVPAGLMLMPPGRLLHWGAAWSTSRAALLAIGGHDLGTCGYHNTDTRLGTRLARVQPSFLCTDPRFTVRHLGRTWCQSAVSDDDRRAVAASRAVPLSHRPTANHGRDFWQSAWFAAAYRVAAAFNPGA